MGNENSSPENDRRNSRKVSQAEVERALERQRKIYERKMQDIVRNQVSAPVPASQPAKREPPPRQQPVPPLMKIKTAVDATNLERQRAPYSFNQNNLPEPTTSRLQNNSSPLYPNLNDNGNSPLSRGNTSPFRQNYSPPRINDFVFVNSNFKGARPSPSAPPAPSNSSQRSRSVSRARSETDNNIECPTCKNRFGVKIFNCASGHACCSDCKQRQKLCARCGSWITDMRNHSLEEYVADLKVPCVNIEEGCLLHFKLGQMEEHLKECPFRELQCLIPGGLCKWKGKLSILATHIQNFHPNHKGDVDTEMFLQMHNMVGDQKRMQLIKIGNFNFLFHLQVSEANKSIYVAVQLLGTKFSAVKWTYEIHLYDKSTPRKKYQYTDKCFSNTEAIDDLIANAKCAVIPIQYAQTFINNGAIAYKYYIRRNFNEKENFHVNRDFDAKDEKRRDVSNTRRGRGYGRGRGRGRGGCNNY